LIVIYHRINFREDRSSLIYQNSFDLFSRPSFVWSLSEFSATKNDGMLYNRQISPSLVVFSD